MAIQTSKRRAVFALITGNPQEMHNWARLVGYAERIEDEGKARISARLEDKSVISLGIDFADDDFARKEFYRLRQSEESVFMGKLEILGNSAEAELALQQMKKRFPAVNYVVYEGAVSSKE